MFYSLTDLIAQVKFNRSYMPTDKYTRRVNDATRDFQDNARRIRQEIINDNYQAAFDQKKQFEELE